MKDGMQLLIIYDEKRFNNRRFVHFLMKRDKKQMFCYATIQSHIARILVERNNLAIENTPILVSGDHIHSGADILLRLAPYLDGSWKMLSLLRLLPSQLRNKTINILLSKN